MATEHPESALPNILIVENDNGEVYIVENKESISKVEKFLKECANVRKIKRDPNSYSPSKSIRFQSIK